MGRTKPAVYRRAAVDKSVRVFSISPIRFLGALVVFSVAAEADEKVRFNRDVRPILSGNCFYCHGPDEKNRQAKLRLDTREGALAARDADAPRASGTLEAHYAPRARLRLMPSAALGEALALWAEAAAKSPAPLATSRLAVYSRTVRVPKAAGLVARVRPGLARAAAFELFAVLRELDALGVALIWVEHPPSGAEWDGVRDRLQRAAAA